MFTELELLNYVLRQSGEDPVTTEESLHPSAITARNSLRDTNKEMQSKGYWFNKEYSVKLQPDVQGHITLPSDVLSVTPYAPRSYLVRRNGKLYDPVKHTYNIDTPVTVDLIMFIPIEDLPDTAAIYLRNQTAYNFFVSDEGDDTKANRLDRAALLALSNLKQEEYKQSRINSNRRPASLYISSGIQPAGGTHDPRYVGGHP